MPVTLAARDRVLAALAGGRVDPLPVGAVTQSATLGQMDAVGAAWPEAHTDAGRMADLADAARTVLGFDFVRVPFDQTVEAGLLGAAVDLGDRRSNCSVRAHPFAPADAPPDAPPADAGRAGVVLDAIGRLRRRLGGETVVVGGVVGPFTLAGQLVGVTSLVTESLLHPERVAPWLDLAVRLGADYARRQAAAGADAICVEDMSAGVELTSPRMYERVVLPAQQRLVAAIPAPVILHMCGGNTRILALMGRAGAAALSLDAKTDLAAAAALGTCAVVGGVPPVEALLHGGVEDVRRAAAASRAAGVHVLAPGCGIPVETPTANLLELARTARSGEGGS